MALLHEAVEEKKFDVRVVERNITKGVISSDEAKKALNQLPDDGENATFVSIDQLAADGEGQPSGMQH
jgi:hypothetical protein